MPAVGFGRWSVFASLSSTSCGFSVQLQHLAVRQKEIGSEPKEVSRLTRSGSSSSARFFSLWSADRSERRCFTLQRLQDELNPPRSSVSRRNENENTTIHRIEKLPGREIFDSSERLDFTFTESSEPVNEEVLEVFSCESLADADWGDSVSSVGLGGPVWSASEQKWNMIIIILSSLPETKVYCMFAAIVFLQ